MPPKSNSEWKAWRIQLASSNPGLNKAGRPYGKGTTSKARMARRARASEEEEEDPPYTPSNHDWGDGWGGGWGESSWGESSWQAWSGEVLCDCLHGFHTLHGFHCFHGVPFGKGWRVSPFSKELVADKAQKYTLIC